MPHSPHHLPNLHAPRFTQVDTGAAADRLYGDVKAVDRFLFLRYQNVESAEDATGLPLRDWAMLAREREEAFQDATTKAANWITEANLAHQRDGTKPPMAYKGFAVANDQEVVIVPSLGDAVLAGEPRVIYYFEQWVGDAITWTHLR